MIPAAAAVAVIAVAAVGCGGGDSTTEPKKTSTTSASRFVGDPWPNGSRAPDFTLEDQTGQQVTLSAHRGRFVALTFLYTSCPDVCPLIATELNKVLHAIGKGRDELEVLAVSVDPANDTKQAVRKFVRSRRLLGQFHYLTGSRRELAPVWRKYFVASQSAANGAVTAHSAYVLLIDRRGKARLVYPAKVKAESILHDLRAMGLS
jgi:protein SCO1/2